MAIGGKSINQVLKDLPAGTDQRADVALHWATAWKAKNDQLVNRIKAAQVAGDETSMAELALELYAMTARKVSALPKVFHALTERTGPRFSSVDDVTSHNERTSVLH